MDDACPDLKPIAIEYLFAGMELAEDIYNFDGRLLLLARGSILTEQMIHQLRRHNKNNLNISVSSKTHRMLIEHGLPPDSVLAQQHLEDVIGYTRIKNQTADMLKQAKYSQLSKRATEKIRNELSETLSLSDPSTIFQCINAPSPMDKYLQRHSVNVGLLNGLMGRWLELNDEEIELLVLAGLVHDVGKTKIPQRILNAPRRLSSGEFAVVKQHPNFSYELLDGSERFPEAVKLVAKYHHEKMNGSGYPEGLVAEEIPLFARITSISDIYDAMVSKRSYKEAQNPFAVIANLQNQQFSELDLRLVKLFMTHMPRELIGKCVLLSDGSIGIVRAIVPEDLAYPIIQINGQVQKTNPALFCQCMVPG